MPRWLRPLSRPAASLGLGEQVDEIHLLPPWRNERLQRRLGERHPLFLPRQQQIEPPPVRVCHRRRRHELSVGEVLVALRLPPAVARHHVVGVEEDVARVRVVSGIGISSRDGSGASARSRTTSQRPGAGRARRQIRYVASDAVGARTRVKSPTIRVAGRILEATGYDLNLRRRID